MSDGAIAPQTATLLDRKHRAFTVGVVATMTMFAFEGVGIVTAMPVVAEQLDGLGLYSWAFNGYVVASLVAMVVAGDWADRAGPRPPMFAGLALFALGALVGGAAWSMPVLIVARVVQGLGGGLAIVTVYVVLARAFPDYLRPKAFALLSIAWVGPSLIGPFISGYLVDYLTWRIVFWIVIPVVLLPALLLAPRMASLGGALGDAERRVGRTRLAVAAAAGLTLVQEGGIRQGLVGVGFAVVGLVLLAYALRGLLPAGSLRLARGLPTAVVMRGLLAGGWFGGETYIPLALRSIRDVPPTVGGIVVSVGAVGWALGSQVQGRTYGRVRRVVLIRSGAVMMTIATLSLPLSMISTVPVWIAAVSCATGAFGMGMAFGAVGTTTLELSEPADQGFNSAALQVCDSVGSVLCIGAAGAIYIAAQANGTVSASTFVSMWLLVAMVGVIAVLAAGRVSRNAPV